MSHDRNCCTLPYGYPLLLRKLSSFRPLLHIGRFFSRIILLPISTSVTHTRSSGYAVFVLLDVHLLSLFLVNRYICSLAATEQQSTDLTEPFYHFPLRMSKKMD